VGRWHGEARGDAGYRVSGRDKKGVGWVKERRLIGQPREKIQMN
jgi:hypothetical protein